MLGSRGALFRLFGMFALSALAGCSISALTGGNSIQAPKATATPPSGGTGDAPVYVPLGGKKPLPGASATAPCASSDDKIALCAKGEVTGEKLGNATIHAGGKDVRVVVYDPKNPPQGAGNADAGDGGTGTMASTGGTATGGTATLGGTSAKATGVATSGGTASSAGQGTSGGTGMGGTGTGTIAGTTTAGSTGLGGDGTANGTTGGTGANVSTGGETAVTTSTLTITMSDSDAHLASISVTLPKQAPIALSWEKGATKTFPSMCLANDATPISVHAQNEEDHRGCLHAPGSQYAQVTQGGPTATMIMDRDCGTDSHDFEGDRALTMTFSCEKTKAVTLTP